MPVQRPSRGGILGLILAAGAAAALAAFGVKLTRRPGQALVPAGGSPWLLKPRLSSLAAVTILAIAGLALTLAGLAVERERERTQLAGAIAGGDPALGPGLMLQYGCAGCHEVRGVPGPRGRVGPPLTTMADRVYVGGMLTNTPDNLVQWIVNPKSVNPRTAMPVTGISATEARHVVAYLLSL